MSTLCSTATIISPGFIRCFHKLPVFFLTLRRVCGFHVDCRAAGLLWSFAKRTSHPCGCPVWRQWHCYVLMMHGKVGSVCHSGGSGTSSSFCFPRGPEKVFLKNAESWLIRAFQWFYTVTQGPLWLSWGALLMWVLFIFTACYFTVGLFLITAPQLLPAECYHWVRVAVKTCSTKHQVPLTSWWQANWTICLVNSGSCSLNVAALPWLLE